MMSGQVSLKENGILDEDLPTLLENVFKCLSKHIYLLYTDDEFSNEVKLRDDIVIPNEICDRFFKYRQDCSEDIDDTFLNIFRDKYKTPLKHVALRNCSITDDGMEILLNHDLVSLSLWYCDHITQKSWQTLIEHGQNLEYLELGRYVEMLKYPEPNEKTPIEFTLDLPHIRKLILTGVVLQPAVNFSNLQQLNYLDLTQCIFHNEFTLGAIVNLPNLTTLILFNVWPLEQELPSICQLKSLRKLDISTGYFNTNNYGTFKNPNETLAQIVESLPELTHLDISGTNLAGNGVAQFEAKEQVRSDIPGLVSRANRPLEFLGLYNTAHSACRRHDIPAHNVSGDANEEQILTSASVYRDRPIMLTKVLNDLYHLLRFETCKSIHRAFEVVLSAMDRHLRVKHMQISGSATLYYIIKGRDKHKYGTPFKNHIIRTLLNGMSTHLNDETMMRNGCLTLCQFSIPNDVLFEYERLVRILLHAVSDTEQEGFVQRIAIYLLNSLACLVDGKQKLFLGDLGAIGTMLTLIYDRLTRQVFDDVMEVAWSTMWNVTDETAINCERFLDGHGMQYFLDCLKCFNDKEELLRNMMGLVGNVAEVKHLRNRLMKSEFITVFSNLLDSDSDGIEVSYNAAGVLAHIASDGPTDWTIDTPSRDEVLNRMARAIERWNLNTERNINYRSFEPILGLVRCYETPECQHWAVWALANLTKVYPSKYCKLVEEEHGLELLRELTQHPRPNEKIKELAEMVIKNCETNKNTESMQLDG